MRHSTGSWVLLGSVLFGGVLVFGCSSDGAGAPEVSTSELDDARAACSFQRGALPKQTLSAQPGTKKLIPDGTVDKIVILMQENRSFDHYFSRLNEYAGRTDIDTTPYALQPEHPNYSGNGPDDGPFRFGSHAPHLCFGDTAHDWGASHLQYNRGKMNGFFATNDGESELNLPPEFRAGDRALYWYDQRDLPFYYNLAATFGIGDRYFASVMGPTFPNRDFLYAGTSGGYAFGYSSEDRSDYPIHQKYDKKNPRTIFDMLEAHDISWKVYNEGEFFGAKVPLHTLVASAIGPEGPITRWGIKSSLHFKKMKEFYEDASKGKLPRVSFIEADLMVTGEHPPANIQKGEQFVANVVNGLMKSKDWAHTALFLTWDEHGGIFDHVAPPPACPPDNSAPIVKDPEDKEYVAEHPNDGFDRYGFRVPVLVVSPYAKPHYVSHVVHDHTSVLRFIEAKFDLPALTARDANADAMLDFFDFHAPSFAKPPTLVSAGNDQAEATYCQKTFGGDSESLSSSILHNFKKIIFGK